ncbi:hypothetical protein [Chryseobacterium luquanense]|uniref:Secretion system C-terminal sorting domain-containing protein n=1 Tax=Chryseobacterium luquanense TaxID=2983766 RepID=A0ABT3XY67_9FLAO|nr:hypothetical protein [Chryseobacterium luquanense]MCX8530808.1 hypothetical protein [Chryseobacterium luquanense]
MKKVLYCFAVFSANWAYGQIIIQPPTSVNFEYDEAGNQKYRGDGVLSRNQNVGLEQTYILDSSDAPTTSAVLTEQEFWNNIGIYPVPVKDILTIDWTENVNDLISSVGLYQQSTVHWVFQSEKIPSLNRKLQINMSKQYMGVYILVFTLKDGRRVSKNITKL